MSGCASCSSRDALRIVMVSPSQATAWRSESLFAVNHGLQPLPGAAFGGVPFIDCDQHLDR
jgi:hypothetical protein